MARSFLHDLNTRIILFDGAMGTEIQKLSPSPQDFPDNKEGFNDGLILTRPDWIKAIHRQYLTVGADCIETNTFGSNRYKLDEYGYGEQTVEFNSKAARLAREVCDEFKDKPRYVIGSMGPSGYLPSSNDPDLGSKTPDEIKYAFVPQAEGLIQNERGAGSPCLERHLLVGAVRRARRRAVFGREAEQRLDRAAGALARRGSRAPGRAGPGRRSPPPPRNRRRPAPSCPRKAAGKIPGASVATTL